MPRSVSIHFGALEMCPKGAPELMFGRHFFPLAALALAASPVEARPLETGRIELVDIPSGAGTAGMVYIDQETTPAEFETDELLDEISPAGSTGKGIDLLRPMNPVYTALRRASVRYRQKWSDLPQVEIPSGPTLKAGQEGKRVELLRHRLGLSPGTRFDKTLSDAIREYKLVHGLPGDGIADAATIASLNRGVDYYERLITINLERAQALPRDERQRYILVDAAAARLWLYEDGKVRDTMRAIVGNSAQETPMIAALIRYAEVNPYWNVPPDFVQNRIAPRVLAEGSSYLRERRYEVLSDWTDRAREIDADEIDWAAVAEGSEQPRVRQLPGQNNSMGKIKFMMPNEYGIYLHDTPDKSLFEKADRWISNGCVRVEDAERLARWLFGEMPNGRSREVQERVDLTEPVPVYITYMTAAPTESGSVVFRADPYKRDATSMARLFGGNDNLETASRD